jgi:hypothetical protein
MSHRVKPTLVSRTARSIFLRRLAPIFLRPIQIAGSIFTNWRIMSHFRQVYGVVGL